jgi:hypothetical protein
VILFGKIICHHQRNSADQLNLCLKKKLLIAQKKKLKTWKNKLIIYITDALYNDQVVQVKHTLIFSMVDGKVIFIDVFVIIMVIIVI